MDSTKLKPKPPQSATEFRTRLEACTSVDQADELGRAFADVFANQPDDAKRDLRVIWKQRREELSQRT